MQHRGDVRQEERHDFLVEEFAELFRVHVSTARRWIAQGSVRAIRLPGGQYRIPAAEIERLRQPM